MEAERPLSMEAVRQPTSAGGGPSIRQPTSAGAGPLFRQPTSEGGTPALGGKRKGRESMSGGRKRSEGGSSHAGSSKTKVQGQIESEEKVPVIDHCKKWWMLDWVGTPGSEGCGLVLYVLIDRKSVV